MTKEQTLQLINDSPDAVFKMQTLSDGQREVIILLDGEDPDYYPNADIAAIDAMKVDDLPDGMVKNAITLRKYQARLKRQRLDKLYSALHKRQTALITPAGVSCRDFTEFMQQNLPKEVE